MSSPMRGGLRALLFDWDGTLADSAAASFRCYSRLFEAFGISFDQERFEKTYSPNWYRTYAAVGLPEDRWAEADTLWLKHYALDKSCLVSGAKEALTRVRQSEQILRIHRAPQALVLKVWPENKPFPARAAARSAAAQMRDPGFFLRKIK